MLQTLESDYFADTLNKHTSQKQLLKKKVLDFITFKSQYPSNGSIPGKFPGFGKTDRRFRSGGHLTGKVHDISHAHLTFDISIVYRIENNILYLYGLYTHDELGTGTPSNINRQDQMASAWANTSFSGLDKETLEPSARDLTDKSRDKAKPSSASSVYTPKAKTQQNLPSRLEQLIQQANNEWPERKFLEKCLAAGLSNKKSIEVLLRIELVYMLTLQQNLKNSRKQLYPDQARYLDALKAVAQELSK